MVSSIFSRPLRLGIAVGLLVLLASVTAEARKNGIAASGCTGCHSGGTPPMVTITSNPAVISPGATVTFSVDITTAGGYAGLFVMVDNGTLTSLAGQGTQLMSGGITHTAPKKAVNGVANFQMGYTAPATPGNVNVNVYALAANGDGTSRGDGPGSGFEAFVYGCSGTVFYRDFDGDGYGAETSGYTRACSLPMYYATILGDCNDSDERIHPGATEVCNKRDDNCNGLIDEGLPIVTYHVDADGDGHGTAAGPTVTDCAPPKGYAPGTDDCNDMDPTVYTGAPELCDYKDNNCNGQVDENARVSCGMGWCRRLGDGCNTSSCTPGQPRAEICNDFDDDCDGVNDNGTDLELCGVAGQVCVKGVCVKAGSVPDAGTSSPVGTAGVSGGVTGVGGQGAGVINPDPGDPGSGSSSGGLRRQEAAGCAFAGGQQPIVAAPLALALALAFARRRRR
jgi:hypothetical protein